MFQKQRHFRIGRHQSFSIRFHFKKPFKTAAETGAAGINNTLGVLKFVFIDFYQWLLLLYINAGGDWYGYLCKTNNNSFPINKMSCKMLARIGSG
jgi:hypothetical protein